MLTIILQPAVKLFALRRSERNGLRDGGDAIPDVLHELDALGDAELERVCDGYFAHGVNRSTRSWRRQDEAQYGNRRIA